MPFLGELAALSAALIWAIAALIYVGVGQTISPLILNFTKGWIALILLGVTLGIGHRLGQPFAELPTAPLQAWILLGLSGALGIGMGDTAYFQALNRIGSRQTLLIETLAPAIAAFLAVTFLGEQLSLRSWLGLGLILAGITGVILERTTQTSTTQTSTTPPADRAGLSDPPHPWQGVLYATIAAVCQAGGAVMSRTALVSSTMDPLWSTVARLSGGMIIMIVWLGIQQNLTTVKKPLQTRQILGTIAITALFSTYLGILLQQISLKYAAAGIAQALSSTSPIFILPLAALAGDRVTIRAILGAIVAIIGVGILFQP
ncbi:MAG: DMT family transporter [Synechococcales bacterium]|nr:DMT family transporter [Synechococcales bacterium]